MFDKLRSKLIAAFTVVIFICLFLAGSAFFYLLRDYQTKLALERLADLALPIALQVRVLERAGVPPEQMASVLSEQATDMGVRVLLLDDQARVVADTQGSLEGQSVRPPDMDLLRPGRVAFFGTYHERGRATLYVVAPRLRSPAVSGPIAERILPRSPSYKVLLAVPQQSVTAAWLELTPSLSIAALLSLAGSTVLALFLSRSIAGPLVQITRASEAMAEGHYEQAIPVRGRDEVARLALGFNKMAREVARSHRTLRDFLANVSHELRTPLTSIQGFSQAMVDGSLQSPADYAEAGRIINEEAERMRRLVEDLLYLSKVESGQVALDLERLDLADLLRACVRRWQRQASEAGLGLQVAVDEAGQVQGDSHRLEQVFTNLLDNAFKHTPAGGTITIRAEPARPGKDEAREGAPSTVVIAIHNTGSVIPAADLPFVFDRFYQARQGRARNAGGSGLGLAIVREIVQAHGGSATVSSDAERGTEFTVLLPAG